MEGNNNNGTYGKIVKFLVYAMFAIVIIGILYLLSKYVLGYFVPFIVAFIIASMLQPLINWMCKKTKISRKIVAVILVTTVVLAAIGISYLIIERAIEELSSLASFVGDKAKELQNDRKLVSEWIAKINSWVPFIDVTEQLEAYWDNLSNNMVGLLQNNISTITSLLTSALMGFIDGFLVVVIVIVSTFYFASDYKKIREFVSIQLKGTVRHYVVIVKNEFVNTIVKFVRAYGLIMFITFLELFIAFSIIGIKYSLLLAFVISLIDILPILGVGTVMIPWGIAMLFTDDYITGIALLSAYLIITIIREIIEPKIVGKYIGLYPLVTLIAMYVGLKAFGLVGLFGLPVLAIILKKLNDEGHIKIWKKPPEGTFYEPTKIGKNKELKKLFKKKK